MIFFRLLENFIEQKKLIFDHIKQILQTDEEDEARIAELSLDIQEINEEFQELCLESWHSLMKRELHLFEAMEVRILIFSINLSQVSYEFWKFLGGQQHLRKKFNRISQSICRRRSSSIYSTSPVTKLI